MVLFNWPKLKFFKRYHIKPWLFFFYKNSEAVFIANRFFYNLDSDFTLDLSFTLFFNTVIKRYSILYWIGGSRVYRSGSDWKYINLTQFSSCLCVSWLISIWKNANFLLQCAESVWKIKERKRETKR